MAIKAYRNESLDQAAKLAGYTDAGAARLAGQTFEEDTNSVRPTDTSNVVPTPTPRNPESTGAGSDFDVNAYWQNLMKKEPTNENVVKEEERKKIQGMIDLVNTGLTRDMQSIATQREGAYGQQQGMSARSGLMGTGIGSAQKGKITSAAAEQERLANAEAQAKILTLMGQADDRALQRIQAERSELQKNTTDYLSFIDKQQVAARNDLKDLSSTGVDIKTLGQDYYDKLVQQSGYEPAVFDMIWEKNKPKAQQIDYNYAWKGDNLVAYGTDPKTGQLITNTYKAEELGIPKSVDPAFQTNENTGEVFWYDKTNPEMDANGNLILKKLGNFKKVPGTNDNTNERAMIQSDMNMIKGSDNYFDTAKYSQVRENIAVNSPKLLSWFDDTYPSQDVLNPDDPTAKKYFQTGTQQIKTEDEEISFGKQLTNYLDSLKDAGYSKRDVEKAVESEYGTITQPVKNWLKQNF